MSQFFRLSTSELASILELVVDVPDHLSVGNRYLNEVAGKTVARRWRALHPDQLDPPRFPENFEIKAAFEISILKVFGRSTDLLNSRTVSVFG